MRAFFINLICLFYPILNKFCVNSRQVSESNWHRHSTPLQVIECKEITAAELGCAVMPAGGL